VSIRSFSSDEGKARLERAIAAAESKTSAEVVIAVRRAASPHHRTTIVFASAAMLVGLAAWWFSPVAYDVRLLPLEMIFVFALGGFVVRSIDPLRRVLTPRATLRAELEREAREAFASLGVANTTGRTGILVVAGLFEHDAAVLADEGLGYESLRAEAVPIERRLAAAVRDGDVESFSVAIESLGALLGTTNPRSEDDENELCDSVR